MSATVRALPPSQEEAAGRPGEALPRGECGSGARRPVGGRMQSQRSVCAQAAITSLLSDVARKHHRVQGQGQGLPAAPRCNAAQDARAPRSTHHGQGPERAAEATAAPRSQSSFTPPDGEPIRFTALRDLPPGHIVVGIDSGGRRFITTSLGQGSYILNASIVAVGRFSGSTNLKAYAAR